MYLPKSPMILTGAYMMPEHRTVEVTTVEELLENLNRLLELSPTSEVTITLRRAPDVLSNDSSD